jgi:hypothetical protein
MTAVYGVWSEADYYGPDLVAIYATRELAEAAARDANLKDPVPFPTHDWPRVVVEHEVLSRIADTSEPETP